VGNRVCYLLRVRCRSSSTRCRRRHHAAHLRHKCLVGANPCRIIGEQWVECEIDEAVYRAEQRFGDLPALLIESIGKRAVVETLCDIFIETSDIWLHGDDLDTWLTTCRMVAASTVPQTLGNYSFFEKQGEYWRLNPQKMLEEDTNPGSDLVQKWCRATDKLLAAPSLLTDERIRPPFHQLHQQLERAKAQLSATSDSLIAQLNQEPDNDYLQEQVSDKIGEIIAGADNLSAHSELQQIFHEASSDVRVDVLRPTLQAHMEDLAKQHAYQRRADLAVLWANYDDDCPLNLDKITREATAWHLINTPAPAVEDVLKAIDTAPTLLRAYPKLHEAVQRELHMRTVDGWLLHGEDVQIVQAFYAHIANLAHARPQLQKEHQVAFDRTVRQQMDKLWQHLEQRGKLFLVLQLRNYLPGTKLNDDQIQYLLGVAQQMCKQYPLTALLLGMFIWRVCPHAHALQAAIANHLAGCHLDLDISELALNRRWKEHVDQTRIEEMRARNLSHAATHMQREQAVLTTLEKLKVDGAGIIHLLETERDELQRLIEKDIQLLAGSSA
jgi:hypothetical protein